MSLRRPQHAISQCYVSIKQLDSPSQRQFQVSCCKRLCNPSDVFGLASNGRHHNRSRGSILHSPYQHAVSTLPSSPWSQCFSRSYASILPTSLGHIAPLTRGYSPRSPDAVIGTVELVREATIREKITNSKPSVTSQTVLEFGSQAGLS